MDNKEQLCFVKYLGFILDELKTVCMYNAQYGWLYRAFFLTRTWIPQKDYATIGVVRSTGHCRAGGAIGRYTAVLLRRGCKFPERVPPSGEHLCSECITSCIYSI